MLRLMRVHTREIFFASLLLLDPRGLTKGKKFINLQKKVGGREQGARKGLGRITTEQRHRKWRVLWGLDEDQGYVTPSVCSEIVCGGPWPYNEAPSTSTESHDLASYYHK
jgi:hypothetical protein